VEFKVYENLNELVAETLCQNSENVHKLKCLQRNCENCGVNNLNLMEEEKVDKEQLPDVQWERYEYVLDFSFIKISVTFGVIFYSYTMILM
jgi:hypothetical protein